MIFFFVILVLFVCSLIFFVYKNTNGRIIDFISGQFNFTSKNLTANINQQKNLNTYEVSAFIDFSRPVAKISDKYLSFSIDISQIVGGKWWNPQAKVIEGGSGTTKANLFDFNNFDLIKLTNELTPAYLRVGGS